MTQRLDSLDNMKGLCIILVVAGHYMEPFRDVSILINASFLFIYLFHMPTFVSISGELAKFKLKRIIEYIWMLFVAQSLYMVLRIGLGMFSYSGLKGFIKAFLFYPYFQLWYLYALIIWIVTIPVLSKVKAKGAPVIIAIACVAGLCGGLFEIGYSLQRPIAFYLFFVIGYFMKNTRWITLSVDNRVKNIFSLMSVGIMVVMFLLIFNKEGSINAEVLFGNVSYLKGNYTWISRLTFYIIAIIMVFSLRLMLSCKTKIMGQIGRNTINIFVFHTIMYTVVEGMGGHKWLLEKNNISLILAYILGMTVINVVLFSNRLFCDKIKMLWELPNKVLSRRFKYVQ